MIDFIYSDEIGVVFTRCCWYGDMTEMEPD